MASPPIGTKRNEPKGKRLKKSSSGKKSLKEQHDSLKEREEQLDKEIAELLAQGVTTDLKPQMQALHKYNEMKDLAQMVLGYLADVEQTTVKELHERYNVPLN